MPTTKSSDFLDFIRDFPIRRFDRGRVVLYQGEIPRHTYVVKKGIIKAYSITPLGEEKIVTFYAEGEIFPQVVLGSDNVASLYYYEGLSDCELHMIPREKMSGFVAENPEGGMRMMMDVMTTNYLGSLMRITALQQPKAQDKLIHALYHLVQRYGRPSPKKQGQFDISIQLTHQTIASFVGLTRETVAGEISRLKRRKIIDYKNQNYTVDKAKLLALINEDSFGNFVY